MRVAGHGPRSTRNGKGRCGLDASFFHADVFRRGYRCTRCTDNGPRRFGNGLSMSTTVEPLPCERLGALECQAGGLEFLRIERQGHVWGPRRPAPAQREGRPRCGTDFVDKQAQALRAIVWREVGRLVHEALRQVQQHRGRGQAKVHRRALAGGVVDFFDPADCRLFLPQWQPTKIEGGTSQGANSSSPWRPSSSRLIA